jgi:hypothetical protein
MMTTLTNENWRLCAAKAYDKPNAIWSEFDEDVARVQYIKRLITKYRQTGQLKEQLILNHLVIWFNVFGKEGIRLLIFRLDKTDLPVIKPFLWLLGRLPPVVDQLNMAEIPHDQTVVDVLMSL